MKSVMTFALVLLLGLTGGALTEGAQAATSSSMPVPAAQQFFTPLALVSPVINADPSQANPIGMGSVANGGNLIDMVIGLGQFSGAVDIYVAIYAPAIDPANTYLVTPTGLSTLAGSGPVPWMSNTSGNVNATVFPIHNIPLSQLPPGTYNFYLVVSPAGNLRTYYIWEASFTRSSQVSLTWIPSSTVKLEQVIGDCDFQAQAQEIVHGQAVTCVPTTSQTVTRADVSGNGQGGAFEADGKMIFFFGDTISSNPSVVNYHAGDPIAWSTSTDPEAGLLLNFYKQSDGSPLFVKPPGIAMGGDDIPNSGISLNGQIYFIVNTGSDTTAANPQVTDYSLLVSFDESAQTFTGGRTISPAGGRFIGTSMHASGSNVYIFGAGPYRASDVYLQMVPASSFASGAGTQYFAGLVNGQPTWVNSEAGAVPVVQDNPTNGPPWPNDNPSVGNMSVVYSSALGLWLMTYDGGRNASGAGHTGMYFTYATQPWGPWATPQLIMNDRRDHAYGLGGFIHDPSVVPDPPGDGLNGPMIGSNNIYTSSGGAFAPQLIERFVTVTGNTLKLYYNVSTWNPYTIVRMRSEFNITRTP